MGRDARIVLATDLSLVTQWDTVHMLEPLSPAVATNPRRELHRARVSAGYDKVARERFVLGPIEDADVAVLPFAWEDTLNDAAKHAAAVTFARAAASAGRATLVFCHHDDPLPVDLPEAVVFRPSMRASSRSPYDVSLPGWVPDVPAVEGFDPEPRPWSATPTVTFCGYAPPLGHGLSPQEWARLWLTKAGLIRRFGASPALPDRVAALRRLRRAKGIRTSFVFRSANFTANWRGLLPRQRDIDPDRYRREYVESLRDGDYVLAVRGYGNFSLRFYEALACARIPLFVDTDAVLPLSSAPEWKDTALMVPHDQARRIGAITRDAHAAARDTFVARQHACRALWERRLSMAGFFATVHERLAAARTREPLHGRGGRDRIALAMADPPLPVT